MLVLVMGEKQRVEIKAAVERAAKHVVSLEEVKRLAKHVSETKSGGVTHQGKEMPHTETVLIPQGFQVCFSFEMQPDGLCRHLSVGVEHGVPHILAVGIIAEEFGFVDGAPRQFWTEEYEDGQLAINIVELVVHSEKKNGKPN